MHYSLLHLTNGIFYYGLVFNVRLIVQMNFRLGLGLFSLPVLMLGSAICSQMDFVRCVVTVNDGYYMEVRFGDTIALKF